MQYVNDDMDELFRRAAENYPLDTSSADFNKVLSVLQGDGTKTIPEKKQNKNGRFLWLLLLLPLGLVCNQLYSPGILNGRGISKSNGAQGNSSPVDNSVHQTSPGSNQDLDSRKSSDGVTLSTGSGDYAGITGDKRSVAPVISPSAHHYPSKKTPSKRSAGRNNADPETASGLGPNGPDSRGGWKTEPASLSRTYVTGIFTQKQLSEPVVLPARSLQPVLDLSSQPSPKQAIQVSKQKKFYAGTVGGLDVTTIKFQKIENAGFNFGLLLGYQVNKNWSIETGASLERKYYYSDAKYFNTSKIYIPPNSRIDDVSGNCKMIEVPLAARYNFGFHKQSNWFSTLGISSYFMINEKYTYNYYYGTTGPVPHTKQYKKSSTDWFSNISVSAGYAHKLGSFADLRIEPYLKLPISGTGIGSLPLFSTGLQIGITKKF